MFPFEKPALTNITVPPNGTLFVPISFPKVGWLTRFVCEIVSGETVPFTVRFFSRAYLDQRSDSASDSDSAEELKLYAITPEFTGLNGVASFFTDDIGYAVSTTEETPGRCFIYAGIRTTSAAPIIVNLLVAGISRRSS